MLRLTLRSGRDGRLLARIVDRDGVLFVLDFGDPATLTDASRRVLHGGFSVHWQGQSETAIPTNPALLRQLALYYASQGLLVFFDEPDWPRIARQGPLDVPRPYSAGPPTLLPDEPNEPELTQLLSRKDLVDLKARLAADAARLRLLPGDVTVVPHDDEEELTQEVSRPDRPGRPGVRPGGGSPGR
ncbi:MAG: hypothetical protein ABMB14_09740 [Myxococcota bacterium]